MNTTKKLIWILLLGIVTTGCEKEDIDLEYNEVRLDYINYLKWEPFTFRIDSQEQMNSIVRFELIAGIRENSSSIPYSELADSIDLPPDKDSVIAKIIEDVNSYPNAAPCEFYDIFVKDHGYNFFPFTVLNNCQDPEIDFDRYTLLGQRIVTGGCKVNCQPTVYRNKDTRQLSFTLNVEKVGSCYTIHFITKWILVDKLPEDYQVNFRVDIKYIDDGFFDS